MEEIGELLADSWWSLGQPETYVWWAAAMLVGLVAFPLTFAFFHRLPDRGYAFSKPLGLVFLAYILWMGSTLGLFPNNRGSIILILVGLALASVVVAGRRRDELRGFVQERWPYILLIESLFAVTLVIVASLRSYISAIDGTEKPMDFAFLNGVLRADQFPAKDPWLAGHDIPLYHFGHIMIGALTKFTGLSSSMTFNLGLALIGGLAAVAVFGVVYNLIVMRGRPAGAILFGLVAAGLLLILANIEGVFELVRAHGGGSSRFFYALVDIDGLDGPASSQKWYPDEWWFWWRATRVSTQWDWRETPFFTFLLGDLHAHLLSIPFVLMGIGIALNTLRWPGALVARVWPGAPSQPTPPGNEPDRTPDDDPGDIPPSSASPAPPSVPSAVGAAGADLAVSTWAGLSFWAAHPLRLLGTSVLLGALGFINLWDLPTLLALVVAMAAVRNYLSEGRLNAAVVGQTLGFALPLLVLAPLLYLPFYLNFHPVGGGIMPIQLASIDGWPPIDTMATRPHHFMYIWLTILWPTATFAIAALGPWHHHRRHWGWALIPALLPFGLWVLLGLAHLGGAGFYDELKLRGDGLDSWRWLDWAGTWWVTLALLLTLVTVAALALGRYLNAGAKEDQGQQCLLFALAVGGTAILILLGTELYWVYDPVGVRSNTVFRLNYQSWIMLSVSGAFGLHYILSRFNWREFLAASPRFLSEVIVASLFGLVVWLLRDNGPLAMTIAIAGMLLAIAYIVWNRTQKDTAASISPHAWAALTILLIGAGLVYPLTATMNRTWGFAVTPHLDGLVAMRGGNPDEYEAVRWLSDNVEGTPIILEAVGGDYSPKGHGRVSSRTGLPTLIGWQDHEYRWRGSWSELGGEPEATDRTAYPDCLTARCVDVARAYTSTSPREAKEILEEYSVQYVYVGHLERETYGEAGLAKFSTFMDVAYRNDTVTIYRMPREVETVVSTP